MSLIHGTIIWYEDDGEATLCDDDGKLRAQACLEDGRWNVYESDEGIHVASVRAEIPDSVRKHLVDALLVAAAEANWVITQVGE